jgi:glycosyltransferase involved in cell wall biosynthesis
VKIAFVGVKRKYSELKPGYVRDFNQYHLEIPWYYAQEGGNHVVLTTVDYESPRDELQRPPGSFLCVKEGNFRSVSDVDVVVHWRRWFEDLYVPGAVNVLHTCDHSYSQDWKDDVLRARSQRKLSGILCYRTWHERNVLGEFWGALTPNDLLPGMTFGVDPSIYHPDVDEGKDPYQLLWASDPGRGLNHAVPVALELFRRDRRFRLHVCHPDYVRIPPINHPAIVWHGNVDNGPRLWGLFNRTGVLLYTSTFREPSSRAYRQAQSAGSMVVYPRGMGTPSELIRSDVDGVLMDGYDINAWADAIQQRVEDGRWVTIGEEARRVAVSESWTVQAQRFNETFGRILACR